jgi:membrane protein
VKIDKLRRVLSGTVTKWWDDNAMRLSAALSYYTLFSLAPLLTIALAMAGLVVDGTMVQREVLSQSQDLLGAAGAQAVGTMLDSASHPTYGTVTTLLSLVTLVVISMGAFSELQDALNLIWRIPSKGRAAVWIALKSRALSFALVMGTGFLLLVSLTISALLAMVEKFLHRTVPGPTLVMGLVHLTVSPIAIAIIFALMFKMLPQGSIAWRDVWLGATVTTILFFVGKWAIVRYLEAAAMGSMYGAASSVMAILLWVYYSALIFFLGAEFTYIYAHEYGSRSS